MDARTELESIAVQVEAKTATAEDRIKSIAGDGTDQAAALEAAKQFMFLKKSHRLYPEFVADDEEANQLAKVTAQFEAALNLS